MRFRSEEKPRVNVHAQTGEDGIEKFGRGESRLGPAAGEEAKGNRGAEECYQDGLVSSDEKVSKEIKCGLQGIV